MTRLKHQTEEVVDGVTVLIKCFETIEYDGKWYISDYEVWLGDELISESIYYPYPGTIKKILDERAKVTKHN